MAQLKANYDVIIIGAGISGLSVAYHLAKEQRFDGSILMLEARERIGGRISTQRLPDNGEMIEMGANWIHGIINNPVYNAAYKYNLINPLKDKALSVQDYNIAGFLSDGRKVPISSIEKLYHHYYEWSKMAENFFNNKPAGAELKFQDSVEMFIEEQVEKYLKENPKGDSELVKFIIRQLLNRECCISGSHSMDEVSLRFFGAYEELAGGNLIIPSGYSELCNKILMDLKNELLSKSQKDRFKLLLGREVTGVLWPGIGSKSKRTSTIKCGNGEIYECNHVVVSIPVGVLKEIHGTLFSPVLPEYKCNSIRSICYGLVDKIFLTYDEPLSPNFLPSGLDAILCFGANNDDWYEKIYSFHLINDDRCLRGWISGKEAELMERMDDRKIGEDLTYWLRKMLNKPNLPFPRHVLVTRWGSDPFARGSYSFIGKNSKNGNIDMDLYGQPIYADPGHEKPVLLFAGEATHRSMFSTTHGAFLSGKKAASYLLNPDQFMDILSNI